MKVSYSIGIDFGTNSVRAAIFNVSNGTEICDSVFAYPSGIEGILQDPNESLSARQNPNDYLLGLEFVLQDVLQIAHKKSPSFDANNIIGIGVSATGSTPLPITKDAKHLSSLPAFSENLASYAWLWKDHSSLKEADLLTKLATQNSTNYIGHYSNNYSSEWFWSKILHCANTSKDVFEAAYSWVELSDYIPAVLCNVEDADQIKRNRCAAGHKAMYHDSWGGLPPTDFFQMASPALGELRRRMKINIVESGEKIGVLSKEWAQRTGLPEGIVIASGMLDAHCGAIGSGIQYGSLIKIMGTSTCDCILAHEENGEPQIKGLSGVVKNSILPNYYGIEAGQSAVGDLFKWFADKIDQRPDAYERLSDELRNIKPGQSGLISLDWNNGCRNIYSNHNVSGLILGQTLNTTKAEIYLALMEATAFGAKMIFDELINSGVKLNEVICCGGLAIKNKRLMQIYADVLGCQIQTITANQSCALGAAISATISARAKHKGYDNYEEAIQNMSAKSEECFLPIPENQAVYAKLYNLYKQLADSFATDQKQSLKNIMIQLRK